MNNFKGNAMRNYGVAVGVYLLSQGVLAFESGSTGADGAFTPSVDTELALPADGIFNFTSVNIPAGVKVTIRRNTLNTPVVWLVNGNVTIAGTLDISGKVSAHVGAAGDGNIGDDGLPGEGGPGGYAGGRGGKVATNDARRGGAGLGPGGGSSSSAYTTGGQGAYATVGTSRADQATAGSTYGSALLLPLLGGSGGGGGSGGTSFSGSGGGGGGGAILIAASGTVDIATTGKVLANGGDSGLVSGSGVGRIGGTGSGGGIRIVATTIKGNGQISATGGHLYDGGDYYGGQGRIRLESEVYQRTTSSTPAHEFGAPSALFVSGAPKLRITQIAGQPISDTPTGYGDVNLPETISNPVEVRFQASGIPVGNVIELNVIPAYGAITKVFSAALAGSADQSEASTSINLPLGSSTLSASVTYTITGPLAQLLEQYTEGNPVAKVRLESPLGGESQAVLITQNGREYPVPTSVLQMVANPA